MRFLILLFSLIFFGCSKGAPTEETVASDKKFEIFNNIPTCSQKDANLNECLKSVFAIMQPRLKDGNKELNIPPIDPFALNRTTFAYENGAIKGRVSIKDSLIYGFAEIKIDDLDFKVNGDKVKYVAKISLPAMNIIGKYKADVDFNGVQIKPHGTFNLTMFNVKIDEVAVGELYEKDGHRFMRLNSIEVEPVIDDLKINATGLFPNANLSELVLSLANQYWRQLYAIMLPETKKYWAPLLLQYVNESLAVVPFDLVIKEK